MIRHIVCLRCSTKGLYNPEYNDFGVEGKKRNRFVSLTAPDLRCDSCNEPLSGIVLAHTLIMRRDERMMDWETVFGTLLPREAVNLAEALSKP